MLIHLAIGNCGSGTFATPFQRLLRSRLLRDIFPDHCASQHAMRRYLSEHASVVLRRLRP
jgi:hypothetical protein